MGNGWIITNHIIIWMSLYFHTINLLYTFFRYFWLFITHQVTPTLSRIIANSTNSSSRNIMTSSHYTWPDTHITTSSAWWVFVITLQCGGILKTINNNNNPQRVFPDSKVHGANMGPIWGRQDPGGPHEPCYMGCYHIKPWCVFLWYYSVVGYFLWHYSVTKTFLWGNEYKFQPFCTYAKQGISLWKAKVAIYLTSYTIGLIFRSCKETKNGLLLAIYSVRLTSWRHDIETFSELPAIFLDESASRRWTAPTNSQQCVALTCYFLLVWISYWANNCVADDAYDAPVASPQCFAAQAYMRIVNLTFMG